MSGGAYLLARLRPPPPSGKADLRRQAGDRGCKALGANACGERRARQAIRPVHRTCAGQQRAFDAFRAEYNTVRPHEALQQETPASRYVASLRAYPSPLPPLEYPGHFLVKQVTTGGTFRFHHKLLYIANSLVGHRRGFEEVDDGRWSIYFNTVLIATLDERDYLIRG